MIASDVLLVLNRNGRIADLDGVVRFAGHSLVLRFDHTGRLVDCALNDRSTPWRQVAPLLTPGFNPGQSERAKLAEQREPARQQTAFASAVVTLAAARGWKLQGASN